MRIHAMLVFGEESRISEFADIVIHGAGSHQLHISIDFTSRLGSEIGNLERMLESSGALLREFAQERIIHIREFHESDG